MPGFFEKIADNILSIEQDMLGPDYNYAKNIQTPKGLGATSEGTMDALGENVKVAIKYVKLLVEGGGEATIDGKPLGTKFYIKTAGKCCTKPDSKGNCSDANTKTRSIYIDNVPIGNIPFLSSGMGVNFSELRGLVPGIIENTNDMNPMGLFAAFGQGATPPCTYKKGAGLSSEAMWGIKNDDRKKAPTGGYIINSDIKEYETIQSRKETFVTGNEILRGEKKQSKKKLARFANAYVTGFSCLLLYLLHRMVNK